ncbi:IPT/TIG domain-containing protein [Thermohalobacter berrensis]|uniref:Fibronectin type-III domain-containing protein n=1 Tax=Thermohalobacter berrensis TaxID=99594 RepID=A0A419T7T6_9FIRM|nr:IPT/TIG domain-containing protein [Thermohalobacter berrensis]RKD33499.1 hypothetical protein BET03_08925 [Thermohalobacter berrensis]
MKFSIKKIVSYIIVFMMIFNLFPWQNIDISLALDVGDAELGKIVVGRTYDEELNFDTMYVELHRDDTDTGDISDVSVLYKTGEGDFEELSNKVIAMEYYVKYELTQEELANYGGSLMINGKEITANFSGVPTVNQLKRTINEDIDEDETTLNTTEYYFEITDGNNLSNLFQDDGEGFHYTVLFEKYGAGVDIEGEDPSIIVEHTNNTFKLENPPRPGDYGSYNLVFQKTNESSGQDPIVEVRHTYVKAFSFVKNLDITNLKMYPNIGTRGDTVSFTGNGLQSDYEVYFLKELDGTDTYNENNKAQFVNFVNNDDGTSTLIVEVPQSLELTEYFVIITDTQNGEIIGEYTVEDKYIVIDSQKKASILSVTPISGPDTGQSVVIEGKNISTLNFYDLQLADGYSDYSYTIDRSDPNYLVIKYHAPGDENNTEIWEYKGENYSIEKRIWVNIGQLQDFEDDPEFSDNLDRLFVNVKLDEVITEETLKDVIVGTETKFINSSGEDDYSFFEDAKPVDGQKYTFEPSKKQPTITEIVPDKVQVENGQIKQDTLFAIYGEDFTIYRNTDESGNVVISYPIVKIYDDASLELEINPNEGTVRDKNGNIVLDSDGAPVQPEMIILEGDNILDGSYGNQIGSKIIVTIPQGVIVSGPGPKDVEVINPIKNSTSPGLSSREDDIIQFTEPLESPVISSVEPSVITVDGGEEIEIIGSNFQEGVKVYIDGNEIPNIERQGDGKSITFTAPPNREAITQLQVINPDGGMAVHEFIYVKTYTDPQITSISPDEGMLETLVMAKGNNFLKPDPTATHTTELGMYRLIGSRILVDGKEVNEYNKENGKIKLQYYKPETGNEILKINSNETLQVADYYYSVLLQEYDSINDELIDNFYTLDIRPNGTIILSDGVDDEYTLIATSSEIKAVKNGGTETYTLIVDESNQDYSEIQFKDSSDTIVKRLRLRTPYKIETDENGNSRITGNRVRVISKEEIHFYFYVDDLAPDGYYDITVVNPDTKSFTVEDGFKFYRSPGSKPEIQSIEPDQGSVDGGYFIEIKGENFKGDGDSKIKVYIGSVKVDNEDIELSPDNKVIKVKVPAYPGDIREELGVDRKTVPVVVVNYDGGSDYLEEGFTYITPTSYPYIERLSQSEGKAAGGDYIQIFGRDFRFYEPYADTNGNAKWDIGEDFTDLNGNGQFDNIISIGTVENLSEDDKNILPKVYFGDTQTEIIDYADGYLLIETPPGEEGNVDVYIVNNDHGISNTVQFTYRFTNPQITDVVPNEGSILGGDIINIHGDEFVESNIEVLTEDENGNDIVEQKTMMLVRFADIEEDTNLEDETSGTIISGKTNVELPGGLNVDYDAVNDTLTVEIEEGDNLYTKTYTGYDDTEKFIDVSKLKDTEDSSYYDKHEYIRVKVEDRRLIVERGYSPHAIIEYEGKLQVEIPSYHSVKTVPLVIINPDGQQAEDEFIYKSPDSEPFIEDITPRTEDPITDDSGETYYAVESVVDGGLVFTIEGGDFRKGVKVMVGTQEAEILSKSYNDDELIVRAPEGREEDIDKKFRIIVINEDGGTIDSTEVSGLSYPIYYIYRAKQTNPIIESITPNEGSVSGGDRIIITGEDFRAYPDEIEVRIGTEKADIDFDESRYDKLVVITPPSDMLGPVDVMVKNTKELGEAVLKNGFTYYSDPEIDNISPDEVSTKGGERVTITGDMFMEGLRVFIDDELVDVTFIDENTIEIITPEGEVGDKVVRIENPDGGIATGNIKYILPIPDKPTGFRAYPGHERSVVLKWDEVPEAERYKIYGREKGEDDYKFIAETDKLEYHLKDLKEDTRYYFRLWAVNDYGESPDYDYEAVTTLEEDEDEGDDKYEEYKEEIDETVIKYTINGAVIDLPSEYRYNEYNINLSDLGNRNINKIQINIPIKAIDEAKGSVNFKDKNVRLYVSLYSLKLGILKFHINDKEDANVIVEITKLSNREKDRITKNLTRKEKVISEAYSINFSLQDGRERINLETIETATFGIMIDKDEVNDDSIYLGKYNPEKNRIEKYDYSVSSDFDYDRREFIHLVYGEIDGNGKFIVIYNK